MDRKILYMSDPHLDFYISEKKMGNTAKLERVMKTRANKLIDDEDTDAIVIIAGDLGHYNLQTVAFVKALKERCHSVIFTLGNHDLYLVSGKQQAKYQFNSHNRVNELKRMVAEINGVHLLDGTTVEIEGKVFGGMPMWYNVNKKPVAELWASGMSDCRFIMEGRKPVIMYAGGWSNSSAIVRPAFDTNKFYARQIASLATIKCDVLITHVCPTKIPDDARDVRYRHDPYNCFYESDNHDLVEQTGAKQVIFGHTHTEMEFKEGDVKYQCNPFGYPREKLLQRLKEVEYE